MNLWAPRTTIPTGSFFFKSAIKFSSISREADLILETPKLNFCIYFSTKLTKKKKFTIGFGVFFLQKNLRKRQISKKNDCKAQSFRFFRNIFMKKNVYKFSNKYFIEYKEFFNLIIFNKTCLNNLSTDFCCSKYYYKYNLYALKTIYMKKRFLVSVY